MPGKGPPPGTGAKADGAAVRRNKPKPEIVLPPSPATKPAAAALPRSYYSGEAGKNGRPLRRQYLPETRAWFDELVSSPESSQYSTVDITYLRSVIAPLYDSFLRAPSRDLASELRLQLTQFGSTPEAKKRQGWVLPKTNDPDRAAAAAPPAEVRRLRAV